MAKGFGEGAWAPWPQSPFGRRRIFAMNKSEPKTRPAIIASRKTCDAEGTGLSHYVLMDTHVTHGQVKQVTK
jgi:modified peptide precursor CbpA